jgi:hypothetical protein
VGCGCCLAALVLAFCWEVSEGVEAPLCVVSAGWLACRFPCGEVLLVLLGELVSVEVLDGDVSVSWFDAVSEGEGVDSRIFSN